MVRMGPMLIDPLEPRRLLAAGDPIPSFGRDGVASFSRAYGHAEPAQVLPLQGGKILFAIGSQYIKIGFPEQPPPADLARFNADGTLDPTFGVAGVADTLLGQVTQAIEQPGGKLLVLGIQDDHAVVIRLNANGALDPSFGTGGRIDLNDGIGFAQLHPDGSVTGISSTEQATIDLVRFRPDGTPDPTFGQAGRVIVRDFYAGREFLFADVRFTASGEAYVVGTRVNDDEREAVVEKYLPDGSRDLTFAGTGEIVLPHPGLVSRAMSLFQLRDGWIVTTTAYDAADASPRMIKFSNDGMVDDAFVNAVNNNPPPLPWVGIGQLVEQPDGKLVAFGADYTSILHDRRMGQAVRYNPDGTIDRSFGTIFLPTGSVTKLTLSADGDTLLVGNENRVTALATSGTAPGPLRVTQTGTLIFSGTTQSEPMHMEAARVRIGKHLHDIGYAATREAWGRLVPLEGVKRVRFDAGAGNDLLVAPLTRKPVTLIGGAGNDVLRAGVGGQVSHIYRVTPADDVVLSGGPGDDDILFYGNAITATGNDGNDRIVGNALIGAPSVIRGGAGNDYIWTSGPRRTHAFDLFGDAGNDHITSGGSFDLLDGGADRDTLLGDTHDTLRAGEA